MAIVPVSTAIHTYEVPGTWLIFYARTVCIDRNESPTNSCRIIGATTMLGVSAYGLLMRAQTPVLQRGQRAFLLGVSGIFAVAGIARATWPDKGQAMNALANADTADNEDR